MNTYKLAAVCSLVFIGMIFVALRMQDGAVSRQPTSTTTNQLTSNTGVEASQGAIYADGHAVKDQGRRNGDTASIIEGRGTMSSTTESHSDSNVAVSITSGQQYVIGLDSPMIVSGTATGVSLLHAAIYFGEPIDQYSLEATSTISVIDGVWSLMIPTELQEPNSFRICLYPAADYDYEWNSANPPSACKDVAIYPRR